MAKVEHMRSKSTESDGAAEPFVEALKILVVEDNETYLDRNVIDEIKARLDKVNFEIENAGTLSAALEKVRTGDFDAALLDLGLPDSKGLETLTRFREASPDLPVIVLTSLRDEELAVEAVRNGAQDYIVKEPLDSRTLVNSILSSVERGEIIQRDARKVELLISRRKLASILGSYPEDRMYAHILHFLMTSSRSRIGMFGYMLGNDYLFLTKVIAKDDKGKSFILDGPTGFARPDWKGLWGDALKERRMASTDDFVEIPGLKAQVRGCIATPIVDKGVLVGIFVLANKPMNPELEDIELLGVASELVGPILHAQRLRDERLVETKWEEEKLKGQEGYIANLVSAENVLFIGLDRKGIIKLFNEGAERITGYTRREVLDKPVLSLLTSGGKLREYYTEYQRLLTTGGMSVMEFEAPLVTRSGEIRTISWYGRKVMARGKELGYSVLGVDITRRRVAEEALVKRSVDAEDSRVRASAYFDFLAHDISNLLSPIMAYAELISIDGKTTGPSKAKADKIVDQVRRASSFILSLRRLEDAELITQERMESKDLGMILDEAVTRVKAEYEDKAISATVVHATEDVMFMGGKHLESIIVGILENSVGASERDDLALEVKATLATEEGQKSLRLELTDDGPGISDDLKECFMVSQDPGKRFAVGMSRGVASPLLISSAIVNHLGGQLWIEDRIPGDYSKGSRVVMKFPQEGFFGT